MIKNNSTEVELNENLILFNYSANDAESVIRALCQCLESGGFVTKEYRDAVIARERKYSTGLPTSVPVAIPHADPGYCIRPAIAIAKLSEAVDFIEMGTQDSIVHTKLVILLALGATSNQVEWLSNLVGLFSDETAMAELMMIETPERLARFFTSKLIQRP